MSLPSKFANRVELVSFSPNGVYLCYITSNDDVFYVLFILLFHK